MSAFDESTTICSLTDRLALKERLFQNHRGIQARLKRIWVRIVLEEMVHFAQERVRIAESRRGEPPPRTERPSGWRRFLEVVGFRRTEPQAPTRRPTEGVSDEIEVARAQLERLLSGPDGAALLKHAEMVAKAIMGSEDEEDAGAPEERSRTPLRRGRKPAGEVLS